MDEQQFLRLLDRFPRIRSSSYCEEEEQGRSSSSKIVHPPNLVTDAAQQQENNESEDAFWFRLKAAVGKKLNPADTARFCDAFKQVHNSLVHGVLSSDTLEKALSTWGSTTDL